MGLLLIIVFGLAISSPSSQSDDNANSSGQILSSGVHIAQYFECFVIFAGAAGEIGEDVAGVSISWLPCIGIRLVDTLCATSWFPGLDFCQLWMLNLAEWL